MITKKKLVLYIWIGINCTNFLNIRDLSNNNLTGGLPDFLGNMKSLSVMYVSVSIFSYTYQIPSEIMVVFNRNLSGNNLSGSIPQALQREGLKLL